MTIFTRNTNIELARSDGCQNLMVLVTVMFGESAKVEKGVFEKFELLERCHARLGASVDTAAFWRQGESIVT
jgi:hypothetical protein